MIEHYFSRKPRASNHPGKAYIRFEDQLFLFHTDASVFSKDRIDKGTKLLSAEPNDGIVLVEDTKLAGMRDFVVLHHAHTFIMNGRDTFERCRRFLELGLF